MSDSINPYEGPQSDIGASAPLAASGGGPLTETALSYLKAASPWLRFMGIMNFIGCGFMFVMGIVFMAIPSIIGSAFDFTEGFLSPVLTGVLFGGVYIVLGVLYFIPSRFMYKFGSKIRSFMQSNSSFELEEALKNNKSYWKFNGIVYIIGLAMIPLFIIIGVVVAVTSLL